MHTLDKLLDELKKKNIALIGMPGAGKSTIGVVLAKRLGFSFLDSDLLIQETYGRLLYQIIEEEGIDSFLEKEGIINSAIDGHSQIIATGGSAIYHSGAMQHLKEIGKVVYLKLSLEEVRQRLGDLNKRGVTMKEGQTLDGLYSERIPYYEKYADITITCDDKSIREIVTEIEEVFT